MSVLRYSPPELFPLEKDLDPLLATLVRAHKPSLGGLFSKSHLAYVEIEEKLRQEMRQVYKEILSFGPLPDVLSPKALLVLLELGLFTEHQILNYLLLYQRDSAFRGVLYALSWALCQLKQSSDEQMSQSEYLFLDHQFLKSLRPFLAGLEAKAGFDLLSAESRALFVDEALLLLQDESASCEVREVFGSNYHWLLKALKKCSENLWEEHEQDRDLLTF